MTYLAVIILLALLAALCGAGKPAIGICAVTGGIAALLHTFAWALS